MTPRGVYRQAKLLELHCMVALNNGSRRIQNNMASKNPEAEGKKRFNYYDDNRGIISGGEGIRRETSTLDVVKTAEQIADSSKCKEMRCEDSFGTPEIGRGDQATNGGQQEMKGIQAR